MLKFVCLSFVATSGITFPGIALPALPSVAYAEIPGVNYTGLNGDYFTGLNTYDFGSSAPVGARAYITPDNPRVHDVFSMAWVMIANPTPNSEEYAQVGWFKSPSMSSPQIFTEWNDGNQDHRVYYGGYNGTTHLYSVVDTNRSGANGGYIKFSYDGHHIGKVYWNKVFVKGNANSIQYNGEVRTTEDQMPGSASNKVQFSSIAYYSNKTKSWITNPYVSNWLQGYNDETQTPYPNDVIDHSKYSSTDSFVEWDTSSSAT